jgi:DNA-binding MurR/RpiR family transcriptional regulator/dienelactone hydrolase
MILDKAPQPGERSGALDRLRVTLSSLTAAEAKVAEKILEDPGLAIALSISEFAQACGVSQPTISRFCHRLGFQGYAAMRIGIANDHAATRIDAKASASSLADQLASAVDTMLQDSQMPMAAHAIRHAPRVDIWPSPGLTYHAGLLSDRLCANDVPASFTPLPDALEARARALPPNSVVVVMSDGDSATGVPAGLAAAKAVGARTLYCATRLHGPLPEGIDWLLPAPSVSVAGVAGAIMAEALSVAVDRVDPFPSPAGPASPWREWRHTRAVFLPAEPEPIPAILLLREDPPRPRPLVIYFCGLGFGKESALPGNRANIAYPGVVAALLNGGYHVLIADALAHGERKRAWQNTKDLIQDSFLGGQLDILSAAQREAPALVDGARALGVTEDQPICVAGTSWGGLQAILTFAGDERIAAAVAVLPVCRIDRVGDLAGLAGNERVRDAEPSARLGPLMAPRPLLVVNGELDQQGLPDDSKALVDGLRHAYPSEHRDRIQQRVLPGAGHSWDPRHATEAVSWLQRFAPSEVEPAIDRA